MSALREDIDTVREFAPILHFHPKEGEFCCFPSDAEEIYEWFSSDWSQFTEDLSPSVINENAPCYYEIWRDDRMIQLRYWFWYRFNRFPGAPFRLGDHLGDWEHIEVRIYHNLNEDVVIWLYSNHLTARLASRPLGYTIDGFTPERLITNENHVHAWVALGSHAHYPLPDSRPYCYARVLCDRIAEGGKTWNTWNNLKALKDTNFASFTGRWGDKKAPRSPTNKYNNRWRNAPDIEPFIIK